MCSWISGLNRGFLARGDVDKLTRQKSHTSFLLLQLCIYVNMSPGWSKALRSTQRTVSMSLCFGSTNAVLQLQHDSTKVSHPLSECNEAKEVTKLFKQLIVRTLVQTVWKQTIPDKPVGENKDWRWNKQRVCLRLFMIGQKGLCRNSRGSHSFAVCIAFQNKGVKNGSLLMLWTHYSSTKMMSWSVSYAAMRFTTLALLRDISRTAISWVTSARQSRPRRLFRMNFAANTLPVAFSTQRLTTANFPLMSQKYTM